MAPARPQEVCERGIRELYVAVKQPTENEAEGNFQRASMPKWRNWQTH